ncbi:MAG: hypothetical protein JNN13_13445 [Planctomycetes bacterium]|nr:hypothetical protein [Planctomycetota bacterium]
MDFSAGYLFASLVVSSVGLGLFLYGKKQARAPQLTAGVLLMGFPCLVTGVGWMLGIATTVLAGLWFACRQGW